MIKYSKRLGYIMAKIRLFIDMGSYKTVIYRDKMGVVLNEPSKVSVRKDEDSTQVVAYGQKATKGDNIYLISPIMEGVIVDENIATAMLREYVRRVTSDSSNSRIEAFMSIPCGASAQDKEKFYTAAYSSNISKLWLVPAPVADLLGCGIGFEDFEYCVLVDIGSGCTDIAILSQNGITEGFTINIGAINIDLAIVSHIQSKYGVKISLTAALSLKEQIGSLIPSGSKNLSVTGIEIRSGERKTITVTGFDILDALREYYQVIADSVSSLLTASEYQVYQKACAQGVIFCGNGSKIEGLKEYMQERLRIPVYVANGARTVYGMQKLSQDKNLTKKVL